MAKQNAAVSLSNFFGKLFHNMHKLILTNILFAVPMAAFFAGFYALSRIAGNFSNVVLFLTIIPAFPFYAGVVQVTAQIVRGDDVAVFKSFFAAFRENFLRFLIHGIVFFFAIFFSYWSISLYAKMGAQNHSLYVLMVISILIAIFFLFMFYYVPSMTVIFDISMKHIYKNSALMTFGEMKSNLLATLGLFILFIICSTFILFCGGAPLAVIIVSSVLILFFVPAIAALIINSAIYRRMYIMIVDKDAESKSVDKKISDKRSELADHKAHKTNSNQIDEELMKLEIDETGNPDEYIYFKGRMVKKSVLLKLREESKESETN